MRAGYIDGSGFAVEIELKNLQPGTLAGRKVPSSDSSHTVFMGKTKFPQVENRGDGVRIISHFFHSARPSIHLRALFLQLKGKTRFSGIFLRNRLFGLK